ncbi:MAG: WD40/YVTN/BNR-like repeat-containing protein [Desertimonas sp.]
MVTWTPSRLAIVLAPVVAATAGIVLGGSAPVEGAVGVSPALTTPADIGSPADDGVWQDVTPSGMSLEAGSCDSYGLQTVAVDPQRPSDVYAQANCAGVWRSTDFGATWEGPINTGIGGRLAGDCAGGITLAPGAEGEPPIIFQGCIRGEGMGFWRSDDGGVSWRRYDVPGAPMGRQDFYPPEVDPYDPDHLLMAGHEFDMLVASDDGGRTWYEISMDPGMNQGVGTAQIAIVDTGDPSTTRDTFLWLAQSTDGSTGTWRTTDGGATWQQVETIEHPHGGGQHYQPEGGVVFLAGQHGTDGSGVYRSTDSGETWERIGIEADAAVVTGTSDRLYAGYSWACGHCEVPANLQTAGFPGDSSWSEIDQPSGMPMGPIRMATTFDGERHIVITTNWMAGLWRYVEPVT